MADHPEIFVLAGPNGAGKSTVAKLLLPEETRVDRFVNADLIAAALNPLAPDASAIEAGRLMLARIRELRDGRETFAFESTLASRSFARFLAEARAVGYLVHVIYVALESSDLAVTRVRHRVQRGGHDIPEGTVRRRFSRSLRNFFRLYMPLADGWSVWDNSGASLIPVARNRGAGGEPIVLAPSRWQRLSVEGTQDDS